MSMPSTIETYLAQHHIDFEVITHSQSFSSMQTAHSAHISPSQLVKSVIIHNGEGYQMCLLPASHVLILGWVDREIGHKHRLATEEEMMSMLPGCEDGAVPALGQAFNMPVLWDHCLSNLSEVYFEAGDHKHIIHMSRDAFMSLLAKAKSMSMSCTPDSVEYYQYIH